MARRASEMFSGGNYLKKEDIRRPAVLHIDDVKMKPIGDDGKRKPVILWEEDRKPMVCNVGNWDALIGHLGDDVDGWKGEPIEVFVDPNVQFGKERVGGLRLRPPGEDGEDDRPRKKRRRKSDDDDDHSRRHTGRAEQSKRRRRDEDDLDDDEDVD